VSSETTISKGIERGKIWAGDRKLVHKTALLPTKLEIEPQRGKIIPKGGHQMSHRGRLKIVKALPQLDH
jgi:hypothetical protein